MNIRKALGYSIISKYLNRVVTLITIVLVARLLTPEELGIFSIASAIAFIIAEFKSFGVGAYLIRSDEINKDLVARALGLNGLISWSAGIIVFLSAWAIEDFYEKPDIALLLQILSISFFLNPYSSIGKSLLEREFKFDTIMVIDAVSSVVVFIATIGLILAEFSYFALALATSLGFVVEFVLILILRPDSFVLVPKFRELKSLASFGVFVTFAQFFRTLSKSVPELVIGKLGSSAQVAYYSRAMGLLSFVNMTVASGIRPVVIPYLSKKKREGNDVGAAYLHASQLLGCIVIPIVAVLTYGSDSIIIFMFGDQWYASTGILSILGFAYMIRIIHSLSPQLLVTTNTEKIMFFKDGFLLALTLVLVLIFFPFGLEMVAFAVVVSSIINFVILTLLLRIKLKIRIRSQFYSLFPNIILTLICLLWAILFNHLIMPLNATNPSLEIISLGFTSAIVWFSAIFLIRHPLRIEVTNILKAIINISKK